MWLLEASGLSKNGYYYDHVTKKDNTKIKEKIEAVLIESPYYGYKRVAHELKNHGEVFNHKRIYKIMGEYFLLQPKRRAKVPKTTNSNHKFTVYANEVKHLGTVIPCWVWVSDITYVWIGNRWVYLALIMDQAGKKIVGWAMSKSIDTELVLEALEMALRENKAPLNSRLKCNFLTW